MVTVTMAGMAKSRAEIQREYRERQKREHSELLATLEAKGARYLGEYPVTVTSTGRVAVRIRGQWWEIGTEEKILNG